MTFNCHGGGWGGGRLDDVADDAIRQVNIPTGEPFVYNFDSDLQPIGEPNEHGFRGKFVAGGWCREER